MHGFRLIARHELAALAALATEFDVAPEPRGAARGGTAAPAGVRKTTWLDTFDWRLHKAGLTLQYVPGRGGSELRLSGAGPGSGSGAEPGKDVTQLVTGWQASRPSSRMTDRTSSGPHGTPQATRSAWTRR